MDITSVLLGQQAQAHKATKEVEMHLEISVKLQTADGWCMLNVIVDSEVNCNFITQLCAKELGLTNTGVPPPQVSIIDSNQLPTYSLCQVECLMMDS